MINTCDDWIDPEIAQNLFCTQISLILLFKLVSLKT